MKGNRLIIFLTVFFVLFGLINYYIWLSGYRAMHGIVARWVLTAYTVVFVVWALSYPFVRILGNYLRTAVADLLSFIGGLWFAGMLYFFLAAVLSDLLTLIAGWIPAWNHLPAETRKMIDFVVFLTLVTVVFVLVVAGHINALRLNVRKLDLKVDKAAGPEKELHIAMASDIHLGHVIDQKFLGRIINTVNKLQPDLVLFPGDLVDEELKPVIDKNIGPLFEQLSPRFGVFAVTGNHEYIGGAEKAVKHLSRFGIRFLRDEIVKIGESFYLCGREDVSVNSFTDHKRKSLKALIHHAGLSLPLIVMDHQPIALNEAAENRADLLLCGHTHHGQLWPLNYITSAVFKISRGYLRLGSTHVFVSSGAGTWGPRVRIGSRPEIISIKLRFS